jgi:hypothetical protein
MTTDGIRVSLFPSGPSSLLDGPPLFGRRSPVVRSLLRYLAARIRGRKGRPTGREIVALYLVYCLTDFDLASLGGSVGCCAASVCTWFKYYKLPTRVQSQWKCGRRRTVRLDRPRLFKVIDTADAAYSLGALFADAQPRAAGDRPAGVEYTVAAIDVWLLRYLRTLLGSGARIRPAYRSAIVGAEKRYAVRTLSIWSVDLARDLFRWGIRPNRTRDGVPFPRIDRALQRHFYRGFLDGDGGISRKRGMKDPLCGWAVSARGSRATLEQLSRYLVSLGFKRPTVGRSPGANIWYMTVTGPWALLLLAHVYSEADPGLPRKKKLACALGKAMNAAYPAGLMRSLRQSGASEKQKTRLPALGRQSNRDATRLANLAVALYEVQADGPRVDHRHCVDRHVSLRT